MAVNHYNVTLLDSKGAPAGTGGMTIEITDDDKFWNCSLTVLDETHNLKMSLSEAPGYGILAIYIVGEEDEEGVEVPVTSLSLLSSIPPYVLSFGQAGLLTLGTETYFVAASLKE